MSVMIKGIKLPTCCDGCFALDDSGDYPYCLISHDQRGYTFRADKRRMPSCPLGEVPIPHGRLIDANECHKYFYDHLDDLHMEIAEIAIEEMPTIIEAEGT